MKILFYDAGQSFDLYTPYNKPIGGSETSILLLSKGLEELGHSCVILNSGNNSSVDGNRKIDSNFLFSEYAKISDVIVLNRSVPREIYDFLDKDIYYYSHDAYDQPNVQWMCEFIEIGNKTIPAWSIFKKILTVSEWQKNTFHKYLNVPNEQMDVLPNSLDESLYYGYQERDENRLIYASIPYKGIQSIGDIFNELVVRTKNDKLNLHVFSSMGLYNQSEKDNEYQEIFHKLSKIKNVVLHDVVSMRELSSELMKSSILLHPNMYHETFGMILTQSQASGCIPVTTDKGAVEEVIDNNENGFIVNEPNIQLQKTKDKYIDSLINILSMNETERYLIRLNCIEKSKKWNYNEVAKKFLEITN